MTQGDDAGPTSPKVVSHTGRTVDGHPLAFNHAPSTALAPWFCWFSLTDGEVAEGSIASDCMFNDLASIRILFGGRWTAETVDGTRVFEPGEHGMALFFGAHSRTMRVTAEGRFKVFTAQLAPGASHVLDGPDMKGVIDRVLDHDELAGHGRLASRFNPGGTPADWLASFETELQRFVARHRSRRPDPLTSSFERCVLANPGITIAEFARDHGVATRTVERMVSRDYGLSPKQVLRRARALDMAAALLGVAMEDEDVELRLRYFDQSHLIREIRHFFGTTPSRLRHEPHPLLRLNLETRQARRLASLDLLEPDRIEPWRDPSAEPRL